jgi:hypothetical protein
MKEQDKVTITNTFHAYRGHTGVITTTGTDGHGEFIFVRLNNGHEVMLEPSDVRVA